MALSIAVVVGSLRRESFNRRLAEALIRLPSAQGHRFTFPAIGDLPLYNQDDDADQPAPTQRLKAEIRAADGVIFVTPEYNRSIPGVLKNAIDHASRPYGDSAWAKTPAGVIGTSQGQPGTAPAQQHLRNVLAYLDMPTLNQPEAFIRFTDDLIGPDGKLAGKATEFAEGWMQAFLAWIEKHRG
ncbi:MAG: NAD(P)H-dependent oxidoreductase [Sphingomonadales bacterium]|nr:NAD(P)H-dependent oxidoreductase [Sphingomonadales bacterium]